MDFETFKKEALKTGIPFSSFTDKGFIDSYAATIPSHNEKHFSMYYPNSLGGVTITKGWGAERKIIFCDKIEDAKEYYDQRWEDVMTKAEKSEIQNQLHRLSKEYNELCEQEREIRRDTAERISEIIRLREESYRRYKELERKISNK